MTEPSHWLVGRERERAQVERLVADAAAGKSCVLEVRGEPGIGKTTLLGETIQIADRHGVARLPIHFQQGEEELPLAAIRRALSAVRDDPDQRRLERLFGVSGRDVRYMIVDAAIQAMMGVIERHEPLVIVLEDCQWADGESLQVMRSVVRRCADRGVATLIAARPVPRPGGLRRLMRMDGVRTTTIELPPFHTSALDDLAIAELGAPPGPRLQQQLARTAGNPLIATEMLREIRRQGLLEIADGVTDLRDGAIPHGPDLDGHVDRRLADLSSTARQIVVLCALSDLTAVQLARLLDRTVAGISVAIAEAVRDGLVREDGARLRLRHDLLRDAVLGRTPPSVRAGLHADLFRLFTAEGADVERVVPHLVGSGDQADESDLITIAEAGRQLVFTAPTVAASLLRRAFVAGIESARADLAFALILLGDVSEANRLIPDDDTTDPKTAASMGLATAQVDFLRGELRWASRRFESVAPELPPDEGALALAYAGLCSLFIGQLDRAEQLSMRAESPDPGPAQWAATGTALQVQGWVAALRGRVEQGVRLAQEGHKLALQAPGAEADANLPDFFLGQALLWNEQLEEAEATIRRGMARSEERGMGWHMASLHAVQADIDIRQGRWDDAEAHVDTALSIVSDLEVEHGLPWCLGAKAEMAIGRGEDASAVLAEMQQVLGRLGGQGTDRLLLLRGTAHLRDGDHAAAAQVLGFLWGRLDQTGLTLRRVQIAPDLMRAAVHADGERAIAVRSWLADLSDRLAGRRLDAARLHAHGLTTGDAAKLVEGSEILWELGDLLQASRMCADAVAVAADVVPAEVVQRAASFLDSAGATAWYEQLAEPASSLVKPVAADGWATLTPAQSRIVYLVGQGLGNAAIAQELSISRRTVESHLHHTYPKLEVESRVQLGLAAARKIDAGWDPMG
ncbi:ATP-binding protein [Euzebya tangerina]|uniref:ATP-binding protein n=1 Tax=Euzebya tangerina TaxID=591198 RepID=UPI000E322237|nr:AAA family ATPase [Euzebya tangerina]